MSEIEDRCWLSQSPPATPPPVDGGTEGGDGLNAYHRDLQPSLPPFHGGTEGGSGDRGSRSSDHAPIAARLSPICGLCLAPFREGDAFKAIYQRRAAPSLSITVHRACFRQLQPGDLTLVFRLLERGLQVPLVELRRLRHLRLL